MERYLSHNSRRQDNCAKIKIYSDEEDEYFSFITPEAFHSLDTWMKYRKDCGENINENSWVMRNLWDVTMPKGKGIVTFPKKLKSTGIKRLVENALWAQRVRIKLELGKRRHEFQADHGFRIIYYNINSILFLIYSINGICH